jgi:hypothetical protein
MDKHLQIHNYMIYLLKHLDSLLKQSVHIEFDFATHFQQLQNQT